MTVTTYIPAHWLYTIIPAVVIVTVLLTLGISFAIKRLAEWGTRKISGILSLPNGWRIPVTARLFYAGTGECTHIEVEVPEVPQPLRDEPAA